MNLFFCGDIMPGGVLAYQDRYISSGLLDFMRGFDFRIGTLEAPIGDNMSFDPVKMEGRMNIIYARDKDFFRVKEMGFDVVSLANNHVFDLGKSGLENTIRVLRENGIQFCGAGMNIEEASHPAVIEKDGEKIAILAYCMYGNKYLGYVELAGKDKAGVNPLDMDKVLADIREARKQYDKVIVLPHWGRDYRFYPMQECINMAKRMIEGGADAVLGSHPHLIQPLIRYRGNPICFSMGNFLFPDFYMIPPRPIWYPASLAEVAEVKDVVGYPFPIDEPIRQVWNDISRYGCIVQLKSKDGYVDSKASYIHLSEANVISMTRLPSSIRRALKSVELKLKYKVVRGFASVFHRIRRIIGRSEK